MVVLLLMASHAFAQNRVITGSVTGQDDGYPLPGVSVVAQPSKIGTQTNSKGLFSISVPKSTKTLVISFIGYVTKTIPLTDASKISVSLAVDAKKLSEVVVVGYGTQNKRELTASIGKVQGEEIAALPTPSFDKSLAGRVTGVRVSESSGFLGSTPIIRIRGTNSISNEGGPLYVVDGIPIFSGGVSGLSSVSTNLLGDINAADIESIEVLKDGSATAIYGSRASSGVIMITTKKGKEGAQKINYNSWAGVTTASKRLNVLNAADFITIENEKFANAGIAAQAFPTLDPSGQPYDTNWHNVIFQKGFQQNHNLSVSGANGKSSYYYSLGYANLNGAIVGNTQTKYNVRANVEQKALDIFTVGVTSGVSYIKNTGLNSGSNSLSGNMVSFP